MSGAISGPAGDLVLAALAHDLKNAFAAILSGSRLIEESLAAISLGEARDLAASLRVQAERSYLLLDELLAWARCRLAGAAREDFDNAGPEPWPERVELEPLLRGALLLYEEPAAARGLCLISEIEPGTAARSDRGMVAVPVRNLVANAVRLSRPGGSVTVRARAEGGWAVVEVADTGPGLERAGLERAQGRGPPPAGRGMGLFLAGEFARLAGGRLEAAERPEGGALFTLTLPGD